MFVSSKWLHLNAFSTGISAIEHEQSFTSHFLFQILKTSYSAFNVLQQSWDVQ